MKIPSWVNELQHNTLPILCKGSAHRTPLIKGMEIGKPMHGSNIKENPDQIIYGVNLRPQY